MLKDRDTQFFDTLPRTKLKSFETKAKKSAVSKAGKDVIPKTDRNLFIMMAVVAQTCQLDMQNVLTHSLCPISWSLATSDGSLRKTNKVALSTFLEKLSPPAECFPDKTTCITDAMGIVQIQKCNQKTFLEVADLLFTCFLMESRQCQRIDIIFDVYRNKSIKNVERFCKGGATSAFSKSILGSHKIKKMAVVYHRIKEQDGVYSFYVERVEGAALQLETLE